jgi:phosphoribosyl 1,2-cyclic phosphodiesterase
VTRLFVLGSGSKGNAFVLEHDGAALLIDAGFSAKELRRRAAVAGVSLDRLVGIALTHEHSDHTTGVRVLTKQFPAPVITSPGTWHRLGERLAHCEHRPAGLASVVEVGPFAIEACLTSHDALEPLAFTIRVPDGVALGVAYDVGRPTAAMRYLLRDATALLVEANHDEVLLRMSEYPPVVRQRIAGSSGHLSNRASADLLGTLLHPALNTVVLAHLSSSCNTPDHARGTVEPPLRAAGFRGALHVALQEHPLDPIELPVSQTQRGGAAAPPPPLLLDL